MQKEYVNPEGIYLTPWKFNQAVMVQGVGKLLLTSGIAGWRPDGSIAEDDILDQASNAYETLKKIIEAAGGTLKDVIRTTIYVGEDYMLHRDELRKIRARYFTDDALPAAALLQIAGFANPAFRFEIDAVAAIGE